MFDNKKVSSFISSKRRAIGLTQQQIAEKLNVSFQAVSKWENGTTFPNTELLTDLSDLLGITVDEMLRGKESDNSGLTYSKAGVDIHYTDTLKREISNSISTDHPRVLNGLGPFASLYDIKFDEIENPVLVLKSEEPGSKQKLAMEYGFTESICHDMINHLVNDIIVMGAAPLAVLDTIVCGNAEKETIKSIVCGISSACKLNDCSLVGGETSIQPGIVENGTYILASSIAGIVDKDKIIDGSKIKDGNIILAVASNGLHTNGYSLVRLLMDEMPQIKNERINNETFIDAIMKPHSAYYKAIKGLIYDEKIKGLAHITGGGIEGNLKRIIPESLTAEIDLSKIRVLPLFKHIKNNGDISEAEMLSTFNCGVGLILVIEPSFADIAIKQIEQYYNCYPIGKITSGHDKVVFTKNLAW